MNTMGSNRETEVVSNSMIQLLKAHGVKVLLLLLPYIGIGLILCEYVLSLRLVQTETFRSLLYVKDIIIGICFGIIIVGYVLCNRRVTSKVSISCNLIHITLLLGVLMGTLYFQMQVPTLLYFFILNYMSYLATWIGISLFLLAMEVIRIWSTHSKKSIPPSNGEEAQFSQWKKP